MSQVAVNSSFSPTYMFTQQLFSPSYYVVSLFLLSNVNFLFAKIYYCDVIVIQI